MVMPSGSVIRRLESGVKKYYHKDVLGSTRAVVTSSGSIVEAQDYYPFGALLPGRSYLSGTAAKECFTGKDYRYQNISA